jgi:hypothetical protein
MRHPLNAETLQIFMKTLAHAAHAPSRIYLVGGASAVLLGWRTATIDIDLKIVPESDELLRSLPRLKEQLHLNIELASPDDFIPEVPGWQERSVFVQQEGRLSFYHYDFYAQALAKIERRHQVDVQDVERMIFSGVVDPTRLLELFISIEDKIHRYPALDLKSFRRAVERVVFDAKQRLENPR